jgi:thiol-disulfide isomerase/thioredoxin
MKLKNVPVLFLFLLWSLIGKGQGTEKIQILRFNELDPLLHLSNDTTYIVNFWATWCVPCRKELPALEKIHEDYAGKPVKVLLVSLDFPNQVESSLVPFLTKNNITARVILLNDPNSNAWIDKVDPAWSGSIPATLIYNKKFRKFFEKELDYDTINTIILQTI